MTPKHRIVITGNSGSGKSTLAHTLAGLLSAAHLDLDDLAWKAADPPVRRAVAESLADVSRFMDAHETWIIEGCYADLLGPAVTRCSLFVFLNPGVDACIHNCASRPWEPHKYPSREAQDAHLPALVAWVRAYETRDDEFSLASHRTLFDTCMSRRVEVMESPPSRDLIAHLLYPPVRGRQPPGGA